MGKQHAPHRGEHIGLVLAQPGELGDGEGGDGHAAAAAAHVSAAESLDEHLRLRRGLGVVPELGRPQHLVLRVEHHHAVLLTGDRDRIDLRCARARVRLLERLPPRGRILLGPR